MTVVDASVQPCFRTPDELREFMSPAYSTRNIPGPQNLWYQAPDGDYHDSLYPEDFPRSFPASDPDTVARHLFEENGVDVAILNPLTRGNHPDFLLSSMVCAATNEWLAQRWNGDARFRGTIRVNPQDVTNAVNEIERWGDDPFFVQVGAPLQSLEPYGKPQFLPIWEAAAAHGLPVALHIDGGSGLDRPPTAAGHTRTYAQYAVMMPLNAFIHLSNLIVQGVFERFPSLVFVFQDGGLDMITSLMYRIDTYWLSLRDMTPWVQTRPSEYLHDHVRFTTSLLDGPTDEAETEEWMGFTGKTDLVMFGSQYPDWKTTRPEETLPGLQGEDRERMLWRNANEIYKLGLN
jgi:predicted TIM-barrel fold metal-dependent hydrolase